MNRVWTIDLCWWKVLLLAGRTVYGADRPVVFGNLLVKIGTVCNAAVLFLVFLLSSDLCIPLKLSGDAHERTWIWSE